MTDLSFTGIFEITFVGGAAPVRVKLETYMMDSYGHYLYLVGENDTIYNWDNIAIIKKLS